MTEARAKCSNCKKELIAMHFEAHDENGVSKKALLGYSRDNTDFWKCDCGTLNLVPQPIS